MHSPRPYGLLVLNGQLNDRDISFIDHEIRKLSNNKAVSKIDSIRQVKNLPDGGYVILQDMGGILKAVAHKELVLDEFELDGLAKLYIPMFYSGVITKARVREFEGVELRITEQCRRRLSNLSNSNDLPSKQLSLQRFTIKPNPNLVPEFIPQYPLGDIITTQYNQQRPTWYSGAMSEVIQIVGGYGRQDFNSLPDNYFERARIKLPDKFIELITIDLEGVRLPAYSGIPPLDGAFQYDYKFHNTHGIVFDNSSKPWLIQVQLNGIYAMPLPIIPATATLAFRQYIVEIGDDEILKILDRFGAMPSGEGFPNGEAFEAWRRAGVVIKVCETSDFYSYFAYSSTCGWSFNLNGSEGFNTAYGYDDKGYAVGVAYKLRFDFSPAINLGWIKRVSVRTDYVEHISEYLRQLIRLLPNGEQKTLAILYKMRRVPQEDIYHRALKSLYDPLGVTLNDVDYWDNYEVKPIANLTGNVALVGKGHLYHYQKPKFQPQIKFPVVEVNGCISFDFLPLGVDGNPLASIDSVKASGAPDCDTIMYGYYDENSLKVIKYFAKWSSYFREKQSNFEDYITVGSWEERAYEGSSSIQGYFYTSDLDFRDTIAPVETYTKIKGEDKGFDSVPFFEFRAFFGMQGKIWRHRYYTHLTQTEATENRKIELGICIPFFQRNAMLFARNDYTSVGKYTETLSLKAVQDPTTYRYWTFDSVFAWRDPLEKQTGKPSPINGSPVWVELEDYGPYPGSDFADQGTWLPNLPYDITWLIHPNSNEWRHSGGGYPPKVTEYRIEKETPAKTIADLNFANVFGFSQIVYSYKPNDWYFLASPNDDGEVFYRDACKVVFGDSEYVNILEIDQSNRRYRWGYCSLVEHKSAYHFIGVINE